MKYILRTLKPPKESFFLFGPRGTGKTTWIQHMFPGAFRIDLLDADLERSYAARPERLKDEVKKLASGGICCIDEVQRVPELLPIVHALIEEGSEIQFILTGSSARKLRRTASDLLGGRAVLRHMYPFLAHELGENFSLSKALSTGMIPIVWESVDPLEKMRAYVGIYLRVEVQAESLVRNIGNFARFMEVVSFSHGSVITTTDIARESAVKRTTVENYLDILEDLLLAFRLPVFTRRAMRALITHPKFYYFDAGIYRYLRPKGPMDQETELEGPALEGLVAQHLHAWVQFQRENHQFAFWRTTTQLEVDFVIYGPKGFWGIEVKRTEELAPRDVRGLKAFKEEYPEANCFIVYGGRKRTVYRGFLCIPVEEFLLSIDSDLPLC